MKSRKMISIALSLAIIMSLVSTSFATDLNMASVQKTVKSGEFSFHITETESVNHSISRSYENTDWEQNHYDPHKTIALLQALGVSQKQIEMMSSETLLKFGTSESINVTTSYSKFDAESNTVVELPEDVAIREAELLSAQQKEAFFSNNISNNTGATTSINSSEFPESNSDSFEDSYMRLTHIASHLGGGVYRFTTNAEWLTMPAVRLKESIGSCALAFVVDNSTRDGHCSYNMVVRDGDHIDSRPVSEILTEYENVSTESSWTGSALVFEIPEDMSHLGSHRMIENYTVSYGYEAHIRNPEHITNFDSIATYDHVTIEFILTPSITIDFSSGLHASIGFSGDISSDQRSVSVPVRYVPD